jgi:transposase
LENFINCHVNALNFYGALPLILVPDNDKAAVTKADRYDPMINRSYQEMADHYGLAIIPARVRRPKDKPSVEKAVNDLALRTVIARLRNRKFFSLDEFNAAIKIELETFIRKPFEKEKNQTRLSKYLAEDKPIMRVLPNKQFEYSTLLLATVNYDYHVEVEKQRYSVPYTYAKFKVLVRLTATSVEISYNNERIAMHSRLFGRKYQYSTKIEHMPKEHQQYTELNKNHFIEWAKSISVEAETIIRSIFKRLSIEQQGYRNCFGIKRLYEVYGEKPFKKACCYLIDKGEVNYYDLKNYLENDMLLDEQSDEKPIRHNNIRGKEYYGRREVSENA